MKKITVKRNGINTNGNKKYLYNFIDTDKTTPTEQVQINNKFGLFGRRTTKGISNQLEPLYMKEWLSRFGTHLSMDCSIELSKAQKDIDRCNNKKGCNSFCSIHNQNTCNILKRHAILMDELSYVQEWLKLDIEEL